MKYKIPVVLICVMSITYLSWGCAGSQSSIQTKDFRLDDVHSILVDYDGKSVTIKESKTDQIIVKEYLNKNHKKFWGKIDTTRGVLSIAEGKRPIGIGISSDLEIYLPNHYKGSILIHTTEGKISSAVSLSLSDCSADTTNGTIALSNLSADKIELTSTNGGLSLDQSISKTCSINTTNGDVQLDTISSAIDYQTKGGELAATGLSGSGTFQASGDGNMSITFSSVSDNVSVYAKNGKITLNLPSKLDFRFTAITKDGHIQTSFPESLSTAGKNVGGTIGSSPNVSVALETKNGDIEVAAK